MSNTRTMLTKIILLGTVLVKASLQQVTLVSTTEHPNHNMLADLADISLRLKLIESKIDTLKLHQVQKCALNEISVYPKNCEEVKTRGNTNSGVYMIKPSLSLQHFAVFCDMETEGGGWTTFLNRFDGSVDFYLSWKEYKSGFGSLTGEHWLGLENLHQITSSEINDLFVEMKDWDGKTVYARYDAFVVGSENEGYVLKALGNYTGDAGESFAYFSGMKFTTKDKDQDERNGSNCAIDEYGAWWYRDCTISNPTGRYLKPEAYKPEYRWEVMYWNTFRGNQYSLKSLKLMLRPRTVN